MIGAVLPLVVGVTSAEICRLPVSPDPLLTHCPDFSCVMSSVHSVGGVDCKGNGLCRRCSGLLQGKL